MNYNEIKEQIEKYSDVIYRTENHCDAKKTKNLLLVSHTLERGGAPLVLLELVPFFQREYNIIFISIEDGDLRNEYLQCGLDIHIGYSVNYAACDSVLWKSFDLVFLNTIVTHTYLPFFLNRDVKVLWWLHEPEMLFRNTFNKIIHFALLSSNIKILSVSAEVQRLVKKYYDVETQILHAVTDDRYERTESVSAKIRFFIPAKLQAVKGQDILAQAILNLPPDYLARTEFVFAGSLDTGQPEYYDLISKLSVALEAVTMLGELTKEQVYQWYRRTDCVLAPSRADSLNMTIVEGMMFNKLCACSTATGISGYMTSGVNGFVFPTEDIEALKELLMFIIDNYETMDEIRANGRALYLEHFERSAVERELLKLIL